MSGCQTPGVAEGWAGSADGHGMGSAENILKCDCGDDHTPL